MRAKRFVMASVCALGISLVGGTALGAGSSDPGLANALSRVGGIFGWTVSLIPPDPCYPPDPCKATLLVDVDHTERSDLDQAVRFFHRDEDGGVQPCVKVLAQTDSSTGFLTSTVDILDGADQNVTITVPTGYRLVSSTPCTTCAPVYVLDSGGASGQ